MKSMKRIQDEMLAKCDWHGGWPRPIVHFPGIIQLVHSQKEYDRVMSGKKWELAVMLCVAAFVVIGSVITIVRGP